MSFLTDIDFLQDSDFSDNGNPKKKKMPYYSWSALGYDYLDVLLHLLNNFPKAGVILFYLIGVSNRQNVVSVKSVDLADIIDLHIIQTRKYLLILKEYKFIQVRRSGGVSFITINPFFTKKVSGHYLDKVNTFKKGFPQIPDKYKNNSKNIIPPIRNFTNKGVIILDEHRTKQKGNDNFEDF